MKYFDYNRGRTSTSDCLLTTVEKEKNPEGVVEKIYIAALSRS